MSETEEMRWRKWNFIFTQIIGRVSFSVCVSFSIGAENSFHSNVCACLCNAKFYSTIHSVYLTVCVYACFCLLPSNSVLSTDFLFLQEYMSIKYAPHCNYTVLMAGVSGVHTKYESIRIVRISVCCCWLVFILLHATTSLYTWLKMLKHLPLWSQSHRVPFCTFALIHWNCEYSQAARQLGSSAQYKAMNTLINAERETEKLAWHRTKNRNRTKRMSMH